MARTLFRLFFFAGKEVLHVRVGVGVLCNLQERVFVMSEDSVISIASLTFVTSDLEESDFEFMSL